MHRRADELALLCTVSMTTTSALPRPANGMPEASGFTAGRTKMVRQEPTNDLLDPFPRVHDHTALPDQQLALVLDPPAVAESSPNTVKGR
jgi:hypothetical protein